MKDNINIEKLEGLVFKQAETSAAENEANAKCHQLQFLKWPLGAGSKDESVPTDSVFTSWAFMDAAL